MSFSEKLIRYQELQWHMYNYTIKPNTSLDNFQKALLDTLEVLHLIDYSIGYNELIDRQNGIQHPNNFFGN